jgi:serine/threonine protein kinase
MPLEDVPDPVPLVSRNVSVRPADEVYLDVDAFQFPIERYRPIEIIGKGALGEVYLCRDALLGKRVAVKRLLTLTDESVVAFQNEAKIASKLKHPNVISVLDFGTTSGGRPFMVMEYFRGTSLANLISNAGRIDERDALSIFIPICRSLQYLHENGVMHRDLKPSNVLVSIDEDGLIDVRLIDFGLSKTNQEYQSKTLLNGHTIVGTPEYMSPDQAQGKRYDAQSEVYSLGCLMFETLTGRQPFSGETALEILNRHVHTPPPLVQELVDDVSDQLNDIVDKCLEKERENRFREVKQIEGALVESVNFQAVEAELDTLSRAGSLSDLETESARESNRSWILMVSSVVAAFSVVLVMVWLIGKTDASSDVTPELQKTQYFAKTEDFFNAQATVDEEAYKRVEYPKDLETGDLPMGLIFEGRGPVTREIQKQVNNKTVCYSIRLVGRQISEGDISLLGKLNPRAIALVKCYGLTERSLKELSSIPDLQAFTLEDCNNVPISGVTVWRQLPELEQLSFIGAGLTDYDLKSLNGLKINTCSLARNPNLTFDGFRLLGGNDKPLYLFLNENQMKRLTEDQKKELTTERNVQLSLEKFNMVRKGNIYNYFEEEQK